MRKLVGYDMTAAAARQVYEAAGIGPVWQLRGQADKRQVADARLALQHNMGLGGARVGTLCQAI
jgi:hypothetical protein